VIAVLLAALLAADVPAAPTAPPDVPPLRDLLAPDQVLERYAAALANVAAPHVVTFHYTVEQTGARDLQQTHEIFRSGTDERDEIVAVDGHHLEPPVVRVNRGKRDRYGVASLAPRPDAYAFHFAGSVHDGHHRDFVFTTTSREGGAFRVTSVTIDGVSFLPDSISFETDAHDGAGTVTYARADRYWMPSTASARGTYAKLVAQERITFNNYGFPPSLPPSTFAQPRRRPALDAAGAAP
jgi:hypothetical protein